MEDRISYKESEELNDFIIKLLTYCGHCVRLGYMKPFTIIHYDLNYAKTRLEHSSECRDMNESYKSFNKNIKEIQLFGRIDDE